MDELLLAVCKIATPFVLLDKICIARWSDNLRASSWWMNIADFFLKKVQVNILSKALHKLCSVYFRKIFCSSLIFSFEKYAWSECSWRWRFHAKENIFVKVFFYRENHLCIILLFVFIIVCNKSISFKFQYFQNICCSFT